MKQYGGNLALNGGGNPLMTGVGLAVGGTLYGIGSLIENNEKPSVEDKEKYGNLYTEKSVNNYESKLNECIKSKGINDFSAQDGDQWNGEDIKSQLEDCHLRIKNGEEKFALFVNNSN